MGERVGVGDVPREQRAQRGSQRRGVQGGPCASTIALPVSLYLLVPFTHDLQLR